MRSLIKNASEIEAMRQGGRILASVLREVSAAVRPGVTTIELDNLATSRLRELGAKPSFLGYKNKEGQSYPASLCTSINSTVVHGIPYAEAVLQEGDLVGLDIGCWYKGLCTDHAVTLPVGKVSPLANKLIKVTRTSLAEALKKVRHGAYVGDIGHAVETYVEVNGFSVVRQLTGHGVGWAVHEEPPIPNFGRAGSGPRLTAGMTLAIEPMVNVGEYEVRTASDDWTVATADGSLSAHFEHTVLVTEKGCEILTKV